MVYRSSAGSGKTHTLVKEYIRLALSSKKDHRRFSRILAITFTNKAAEEMKERVIRNLNMLSVSSSHPQFNSEYLKEMAEFCELTAEEIQDRAKKVFESLLHNYHLLKITTIDRFTVQLVYAFARDLEIDAEYEIVLNQDEVIDNAIQLLLDKSGKDAELTRIILATLQTELDEGNKFNAAKELRKFAKRIFNEKGVEALEVASQFTEKDFEETGILAGQRVKAMHGKLTEMAKTLLKFFEDHAIGSQDLYYSNSGIYGVTKTIAEKGFDTDRSLRNAQAFIDGTFYSKTAKADIKKKVDLVAPEIIALAKPMIDYLLENRDDFLIHSCVKKSAFSMTIYGRLHDAIQEYKRINSIMLLSEFSKLVSQKIMNEPAPFIYERVGERVNNIFVDEFQDTSELQFTNLIPLMENSLAAENLVLLVGDAKQSIYRWRNGNVEQFVNLPELPKASIENEPYRAKKFDDEMKAENLDKNYRSSEQVIEFNNQFFTLLTQHEKFDHDLIQKAYKQVKQETDPKKPGGYVFAEIIPPAKESKLASNLEDTSDDESEEESVLPVAPAIDFSIKTINDALSRGYNYKDIVLLVRSNLEGEKLVEGLSAASIPVVSNQALSIGTSPLLKSVLACMEYIHLRGTLSAYRKLALNLSIVTDRPDYFLHEIHNPEQLSRWERLNKLMGWFSIEFKLNDLLRLNLFEQINYLIQVFGADVNNVFVTTFLAQVFDFYKRNGSDATGYIRYWNNKGKEETIQTGDSGNRVKVYTVHKSKGLQFPIVIIPFLTSQINRTEKFFWLYDLPGYKVKPIPIDFSEKIELTKFNDLYQLEKARSYFDVLNLWYVACTRAEKELYLLVDRTGGRGQFTKYASEILIQMLPNNQGNLFEFGSKTIGLGLVETMTNDQVDSIGKQVIKPWHERMLVSTKKYLDTIDDDESRNEGVLIHEVFAQIHSSTEIDKVIRKFVMNGRMKEELAKSTSLSLREYFDSAQHHEFDLRLKKVFNEQSFTDSSGRIFRADKMYEFQDGTLAVIDLKTGNEDEKHNLQVSNYAQLLSKAGLKVESAWLYYVKTRTWKSVPTSLN